MYTADPKCALVYQYLLISFAPPTSSRQLLPQLQEKARLSDVVRQLHQHKLNSALLLASNKGYYKMVCELVDAGACNFDECIKGSQHPNHIIAFLRLCQAAYEDDRTAVQLLLEQDEVQIARHPRYPSLTTYHQILKPLLDNGKLSVASPIRVAMRAGHVLAAGNILLRAAKHPSSGLVDWHGLGLESIPAAWLKVLEYPNLQFLSLSFNKLKQVPLEICKFQRLTKLQMSNNAITFVPSEVFQLPNIEHLDLSYNTIALLPEALLTQVSPVLAELYLSNNKLASFPGYFEDSSLRELDLSCNLLREVPKSVCKLRQLHSLNLSHNIEIRFIPYELGGLRSLEVLSVEGLPFAANISRKQNKFPALPFLRKRFQSMQTVTHFELVVVGFPSHQAAKEKLLSALSAVDLGNGSVLTYHNPQQFLCLHQVFQLPSAVYLLVWDCQNRQDVNQLHCILRHLSIYAPRAPVIVAACWKSFISSHSELAVEDSISKSAWQDLSEKVMLKHVVLGGAQDVPDEEHQIQSLASLIVELADRVKATLFVPETYYRCIEYIQQKRERLMSEVSAPMLTEWDFWELIRTLPNHDLASHRELPEVVSFLTSKAILLHVPCARKGVQTLYVLDRVWFCDVLGHAVSSRHDAVGYRNFTAIVLQEGLIDLLNCHTLTQPLPDALRHFVNEHGIALALSSQKWVIPAMLSTKPDEIASDFSSQYGIRRQYTFCLTPITFWGRLITHLVINMESLVRDVSEDSLAQPITIGLERNAQLTSLNRQSTLVDWTYWASGIVCWKNACNLVYSIEAITTKSNPYMEGLEIRVPFSSAGCRTIHRLTYIIDSILCNWYPTIWPTVELWVPCSYCLHTKNPDVPSISFQDCLLAVSKGVGIKCLQHSEKVVPIGKIVPDLVQQDVVRDILLPPGSVQFNPHDKSTCLSPPPSETIFKGLCSEQLVVVKPFPSPVPSLVRQESVTQEKTDARPVPPFLDAWMELQTLRHLEGNECPFVLHMVGACPDPLCLVFPFAKWNSLEDVIQAKDIHIPHLVRLKMVYQLASALSTIHSSHVIHRNVCLANILVYSLSADDPVNIKLGGFSKACYGVFQGVTKGYHGRFIPPEMAHEASGEYDERVDIFALAFVAYEIILRSHVHLQTQIPLQKLSSSAERPSLQPIATRAPYLVSLIDKCWAADSARRPFASEVVSHLNEPLHMAIRCGISIKDDQEFFAGAAKFTRVQNSFHADVFVSSGPLMGEGTTFLTHISAPSLSCKSCTDLPSEYVICMCCVGSQLWVSFYGKKVRVYDTSNLEFKSEFKFKHHVSAMAVSPTSVYLALENGVVQVYNVSDENTVPTEPMLTQVICQGKDFRCIEALEGCLVCANKNTIFRVHPDTLAIEARWPIVTESEIRSVAMTEFGDTNDTLWIAFRRLDRVEVLNAWTGAFCYVVEVSRVIHGMERGKVWVLTMRVVLDTVWIGLNTGHILVFSSNATEPRLLTLYRVHQEDVRHLLLLHPSYMGPSSILFASEGQNRPPSPSHREATPHCNLPESVFVLSCGQGLFEALPTLDDDGVIVPLRAHQSNLGGLFAVVMEGMSEYRTAQLEKNSGRVATEYMFTSNDDDPLYDIPPGENVDDTINIFRTDTWTAPLGRTSPVLSKRRPFLQPSIDLSHSYTRVCPPASSRLSTASTVSTWSTDGDKPSRVSPPPLPPRTFKAPPPPPPPPSSSIHEDEKEELPPTPTEVLSIYDTLELELEEEKTIPLSPSILDSCGLGESYEPYVRMGSVFTDPRPQRTVSAATAPPIPPRGTGRRSAAD